MAKERNQKGREAGVQALLEIGKLFRQYMEEAEEHEDREVFNSSSAEQRMYDFVLYLIHTKGWQQPL